MTKTETLVLIPSWGMGHIIPFAQLANHLTTTISSISISIVLFEPPFDITTTIDPFISRVTASNPSITFHRLPPPSLPPNHLSDGRQPFGFDLLRFTNTHLTQFLTSLSQTTHIRALILDMFCSSSLDVARQLSIPTYFFYSCSVTVLVAFVSLPSIRSKTTEKFGNRPLPIPGFPPIPASYLPFELLDAEPELCNGFMFHLERHPKSDGIIVNSFEELEADVVKAVNDGVYGPMPPIYCIGPLISDERKEESEKVPCLKWLDEQPKGSVVFLCFGSQGSFSVEQLKEIAGGLERSGQRFLWVVKGPLVVGPTKLKEKRMKFGETVDPDLDGMLPEGFMERTKGRGMVVKTWAPQIEVLEHEAVGGFVSHCGWNSILEAVNAGVAMIAWPLYAEQKMNKVFLVEVAKIAVEMEGSDDEIVRGEEVEKKVRWLMETEGGRELKERVKTMGEIAVGARKKGGSSDLAWINFVNLIK